MSPTQVLCWTCKEPLITTDPGEVRLGDEGDSYWIKAAPWRCPKGCEKVAGPPPASFAEDAEPRHMKALYDPVSLAEGLTTFADMMHANRHIHETGDDEFVLTGKDDETNMRRAVHVLLQHTEGR